MYQIFNRFFMVLRYIKFLRMLIEIIPKRISGQSENNKFCSAQVF